MRCMAFWKATLCVVLSLVLPQQIIQSYFSPLSPMKYLLHRIYETVCKCLAAPTPRFLMTLNFGMVLNTLNWWTFILKVFFIWLKATSALLRVLLCCMVSTITVLSIWCPKMAQQLARLFYPAGRRKERFYPSDSGKSCNHPAVFERLHPGQWLEHKESRKGPRKARSYALRIGPFHASECPDKTDWNESEIQTRALWLYKQAQSLWKF